MKNIKYVLLAGILIGFAACNEIEDVDRAEDLVILPELTSGDVDFSNYVAVGASFTAGFTDNALFKAGQENSFPNLLAQQFAKVGGGNFTQPLMNDNIGGLLFNGVPMPDGSFGPRLFFNGAGPAVLPAVPTTEATSNLGGTFNNVGVPGAKSFHGALNGYGAFNPYFGRMASSPGASMIEDALAQGPTFFTLSEIGGGNDVLSYAISGGTGVDQTGNTNPLLYGNNDITDPNVFAASFSGMLAALTQNGAKGVVTTVPDITSLSHFTTVPHNPLDPSNPSFGPQIPTLNGIFGALNQIFAQVDPSRIIVFSETEASPVVINDESLANLSAVIAGGLLSDLPAFEAFIAQFGLPPQFAGPVANLLGLTYGQARQATADDLLVLPSSSVIGTVNGDSVAFLMMQGLPAALAGQFSVEGVSLPLADKWVLLPSEQLEIATATAAYNATINALANSNANVAVADLRAVLEQAATTGYPYDEYTMTTSLVFGGLVSLDGVHLTARGYGLMAKEFLAATDAAFGSNFIEAGATPKAGDLPTNYSPMLQN